MGEEALRNRVRELAPGLGKDAPPWEPPALSDFMPYIRVTAFDQTLSHCGYARLEVFPADEIALPSLHLMNQGTININSKRSGFNGTWDKGLQLRQRLEHLPFDPSLGVIVIEHPLVGPGYRPESALVAGYAICDYAGCVVDSMSARQVSKIMVGNPHHDKAEIAAAVARYIPASQVRSWSEHSRDAAAMALAYLYNRKKLAMAEKDG